MKYIFSAVICLLCLFSAGCREDATHLNHALELKDKIYQLYDVDQTPLLAETYPRPEEGKGNKYSYLWPYSSTLSMMSALYEATRDEAVLEVIDRQVVEGLEMYYDSSREPAGYASYITTKESDRYYDDNIWLVIDFVDLYTLTGKQSYLDKAVEIWQFVLSGRDTVLGDGIYWCEQNKTTKNACSNAPAAVAALKLHKATGDEQYFEHGENLYTWMYYSLRDKDNLYFDNVSVKGKFDKRKFSYNSGAMIQAGALLYEITGDEQYLRQAQATAAASAHQWTQVYTNRKGESLYIVESGDVWFDAVLLRGYISLWQADKQDVYISFYDDTLRYSWYMGRDENGLFGKYLTHRTEGERSPLLTQAAYVEMSARMAATGWKKK
jgi:predicted alpha-1,6-mannanase (GH76 family)